MRLAIIRLLLGFSLATVVSAGVYFRGKSIRGKSAPAPAGRDMQVDKPRGLEMAAYEAPAILIPALFSPSFLQVLFYRSKFYDDHASTYRMEEITPEIAAKVESASGTEGLLWGVAQGVAFYLPFFLNLGKKERDGNTVDAAQ